MTLSNILLKSNINDVADFLCKDQEELEKSWKKWAKIAALVGGAIFAGNELSNRMTPMPNPVQQRKATPSEEKDLKRFEKKLEGLEGEEPPPLYWEGDNNVKQGR